MNLMKSENFWLKASAITFLVTLIGGIVIQYGPASETARLICMSLFGVSGVYLFSEIIVEKKALKNLIRLFGYPAAVAVGIFIVVGLGDAWIGILESEFDKNAAEYAQKGLYEVCWAFPCCIIAMIKNSDATLIRIIEWKYFFIGLPMLMAFIGLVVALPSALSEINADMNKNRKINAHLKEVNQQNREHEIATLTSPQGS